MLGRSESSCSPYGVQQGSSNAPMFRQRGGGVAVLEQDVARVLGGGHRRGLLAEMKNARPRPCVHDNKALVRALPWVGWQPPASRAHQWIEGSSATTAIVAAHVRQAVTSTQDTSSAKVRFSVRRVSSWTRPLTMSRSAICAALTASSSSNSVA